MAANDDLDALYAAPLSGFLEARKALALERKKAGDKQGATAIAALPKPTPAAWAVNQVARKNATDMAALIELGGEIRNVMRAGLRGDTSVRARLRTLEAEQQEMIGMLITLATALLEADGANSAPATLERIKTTFTTISTTGTWGESAAGRLHKELGLPNVEALAALLLDDVAGVAPKREVPKKAEPPAAEKQAHAAAARAAEKKRAIEEATRALADAEQQATDTVDAAQAAQRTHDEAAKALLQRSEEDSSERERIEALETALSEAREQAREAASALRTAKSVLASTDEPLSRAQRAEAEAARTLLKAQQKLELTKKA